MMWSFILWLVLLMKRKDVKSVGEVVCKVLFFGLVFIVDWLRWEDFYFDWLEWVVCVFELIMSLICLKVFVVVKEIFCSNCVFCFWLIGVVLIWCCS